VKEPRFSSTDSAVIRGIWKSSIRVLTFRSVVGSRRARPEGEGGARAERQAGYFE
jgi:hypothetical protein